MIQLSFDGTDSIKLLRQRKEQDGRKIMKGLGILKAVGILSQSTMGLEIPPISVRVLLWPIEIHSMPKRG